jgi:phage-related protein
MPQTDVFFYRDEDGTVPVLAWLQELAASNRRAAAACIAKLRLLAAFGHELRRPNADYLRDGIYELRVRRGKVNYRILYFCLLTRIRG